MRTRYVRRDAALDGKTFDDVLEEKAHAGTPWEFAERRFCLKGARKGGKKGEDVERQCEGVDVDTSTEPSSTTASSIKSESAILLTDDKREGKLTYKTQILLPQLTGAQTQPDELLMARRNHTTLDYSKAS